MPALVAHLLLGRGEEVVARLLDPADAVARVAGVAVERGQGPGDRLGVRRRPRRERRDGLERRGQGRALAVAQVVVGARPCPAIAARQPLPAASAASGGASERRRDRLAVVLELVARRAADRGEQLAALRGELGVDREPVVVAVCRRRLARPSPSSERKPASGCRLRPGPSNSTSSSTSPPALKKSTTTRCVPLLEPDRALLLLRRGGCRRCRRRACRRRTACCRRRRSVKKVYSPVAVDPKNALEPEGDVVLAARRRRGRSRRPGPVALGSSLAKSGSLSQDLRPRNSGSPGSGGTRA